VLLIYDAEFRFQTRRHYFSNQPAVRFALMITVHQVFEAPCC
jgi:hypothetical protein